MRRWSSCLFMGCLSISAWAAEPLQLLGKSIMASQRLNYSGTFVYQHGGQTEVSRITHALEGGKEYEHLEVLDGSPREVVREGDEVKCYLPDTRTVFIERKSERGVFPILLPASLASITEHYQVRQGPGARVAGYETHSIVLEPKDEFRYGHHFWMESQSGLILKAALSNEKHELLESFSFSDLKIGGNINLDRLRARLIASEDWKVMHSATKEGRVEDGGWSFRNLPAGFVRTSGMRRQLQLNSPETRHYIFSDGLASVSVFIEPASKLAKSKPEPGLTHMGAIHAYRRLVGDFQIMVVGEVPAVAVRRIGDGVELRKRY